MTRRTRVSWAKRPRRVKSCKTGHIFCITSQSQIQMICSLDQHWTWAHIWPRPSRSQTPLAWPRPTWRTRPIPRGVAESCRRGRRRFRRSWWPIGWGWEGWTRCLWRDSRDFASAARGERRGRWLGAGLGYLEEEWQWLCLLGRYWWEW